MTAPLRSTQFYEGTPPVVGGVSTWTSVYTVPAGHRIILKSIHAYNAGAASTTVSVRINASQIWTDLTLVTSGSVDYMPWLVFNPTEFLSVYQKVGGSALYVLSGYLLYI